ncbi:hypothetical protein GCM10022206_12770 [Streptomyces chiangmaiensis]
MIHLRASRRPGPRPEVFLTPVRTTSEVLVTAENIVGLIVAIALLAYLVVALIKPERF